MNIGIGAYKNGYTTVVPTATKFYNNSVTGCQPNKFADADTGVSLNASGNWWGSELVSDVTVNRFGGTGTIDYTPWLHFGTDLNPLLPIPGFQGDFSWLHVDDASQQLGTPLRVQEGHDMVTAAGRVYVEAGTYAESVNISKAVTMHGDPGLPNVTGPGPNAPVMDGTSFTAKNGFNIVPGTSNITIEGFEIKNYGPGLSGGDSNGVLVYNKNATPYPSNNVIVRDNYFHHIGWNGVLVWNEGQTVNDNWTISRNKADNIGAYAYELTNAKNSRIEFNESTGCTGAIIQAWAEYGNVAMQNNTLEGNTFGAAPDYGVFVLSYSASASKTADVGAITIKNNVVTAPISALLIYNNGVGATIHDFTVTGNQLTVNNPATNYRAVYLSNVGGTSTFAANIIAVTGTPAAV